MKALRLLALACLVNVLSASSLTWDRTEARLQLAPNESMAKARYEVTNRSDQPLRIDRVESSCGCTGSVIGRRILKANESTAITATFNKGKRTGTNHNKLSVYIEGQQEPVATLHLIVDIPELITAKPQIVYWNSRTSQTARTVEVSLNPDYVQQLESIQFDDALVQVDRAPHTDTPHKFSLTIAPVDYSKALRHSIEIQCLTIDGTSTTQKIHVFAQP